MQKIEQQLGSCVNSLFASIFLLFPKIVHDFPDGFFDIVDSFS
jgi:hypothetical protein